MQNMFPFLPPGSQTIFNIDDDNPDNNGFCQATFKIEGSLKLKQTSEGEWITQYVIPQQQNNIKNKILSLPPKPKKKAKMLALTSSESKKVKRKREPNVEGEDWPGRTSYQKTTVNPKPFESFYVVEDKDMDELMFYKHLKAYTKDEIDQLVGMLPPKNEKVYDNKLKSKRLTNCYFAPNIDDEFFEKFMKTIEKACEKTDGALYIYPLGGQACDSQGAPFDIWVKVERKPDKKHFILCTFHWDGQSLDKTVTEASTAWNAVCEKAGVVSKSADQKQAWSRFRIFVIVDGNTMDVPLCSVLPHPLRHASTPNAALKPESYSTELKRRKTENSSSEDEEEEDDFILPF